MVLVRDPSGNTVYTGRLDSTEFWKIQLGFEDEDADVTFQQRKTAILNRLRERWPTRHHLDRKSEQDYAKVKDWLRPLMATFLSTRDLELQNRDYWVAVYASWAMSINTQSRDKPGGASTDREIRTSRRGAETRTRAGVGARAQLDSNGNAGPNDRLIGLFTADRSNAEERNTKRRQTPQVPLSINTTTIPPATHANDDTYLHHTEVFQSSSTNSSLASVDWTTIEVAIDATVLGLDTVWLPMFKLMPRTDKQCHWSEFNVNKLLANFEDDTGRSINPETHELTYDDFPFTRNGAYQVALKRFAQISQERRNVLNLRLRLKRSGDGQENEETQTVGNGGRFTRSWGRTLRPRRSLAIILSDAEEDSE